MTELEFLRLQVQGIPVHKHNSPKRGEWFCRSPYCLSLLEEVPRPGPNEHPELGTTYDLGALDA
jgi:hypothetical protein